MKNQKQKNTDNLITCILKTTILKRYQGPAVPNILHI